MKKKPVPCTRQGKSNNNIKSFLSNLDDLHFENSQITQCVFLGVLRLKPVPSVVVENKSKKYKNNNSAKEVNKNISSKKDINKVISGKIRKKNLDRIKASVKKLPTKKPVIKFKLNMNKNKKDIIQDSLTKITPETIIQNKTTLNPIQTVSTFNPVQNLFDKLKQQMDDKYNRPGCSEVTKEILFSSEVIADNQKNKRTKKIMKKKPIFERLVMPLLPSSVSFSDNGYHSSTSHTKSNDDVIVINEEIESSGDEQKVFVNTVTLPDFELRSSTVKSDNNDIILIDDSSNRELTVIDDSRNVRTSPRLNRNDPNKEKTDLIIVQENNVESNSTDEKTDISKNSSEKPRKRRTLLPAIPLNFFNTTMLLRSELAQKKGGSTENRPSSRGSTSKMQRSDVRQEKSPVKQRKSRNSTENLIYEVVKSSTAIPDQNPTENSVIPTKNDIILVDNCSPPKVEPLIIKLKVSQNKNTNEETESTENKNKLQKVEVTKNLFFPRLLRSDVNQEKTNKEDIVVKKVLNTTDSAVISPGKISVKPDSYLKEKLPKKELFVENENTTKEKLLNNNNNKTEKSPESPQRRHLRSDLETIINTDDGQESNKNNLIINNVETTSEPSVSNIDKTLQNQENADQLRSIDNQKKILDSDIIDPDKTPPNADKITEIDTIYRQLRSKQISKNSDQDIVIIYPKTPSKSKDVVQNQIAYETPSEIEVINVTQFYTQTDKSTQEKDTEDDSNNNQSNILNITSRRSLRSDLVAKESVDSEISKVSKIKIKEEPIVKHVRSETEISTTVVEVANKDSPIPKNNITQKEVIKPFIEIKDNTIKSSDSNPKSVKSKDEVIKTRRSKILDIDLIDYAHISVDTTIPRKLRSEIVQKKIVDGESQKKLLKVKVEVNDDADKSQHRQLRSEKILIEPKKITTESTDILKNISKTKISSNTQKENVSKPAEKCSEIKINRLSRSTQKFVESETNKASKSTEIDGKPKRNRSTSKPNEKSEENKNVSKKRAFKLGEKSQEVINITDNVEEKVTKTIKKTIKPDKIVKKVTKPAKKVTVATKIKEKLKKSVTKNNKIQPAKDHKKKAIKIEDKNIDLTKKITKNKEKRKNTKKSNIKPNKISNKKEPNPTSKKKSPGRKIKADRNTPILRSKITDNLLSIKSEEKNKLTQKKQEDFDEITVVTEKRMKKQKDSSARTLRSSFVPVLIKKEEPDEEPAAAVVEKVVALIHSEPKPKNLETEMKSDKDIKPRILRSQHFNQIEDINEIKEVLPTRKINKRKNKEVGLSEKSKVITKNKKVVGTKKLKTKKSPKKETVAKGKSKIQNLTKINVKSKLKTGKKSLNKKKLASKDKLLNNEIIERIIEELKNTLFNQESVTNKVINKKLVPKKMLKKKEVVKSRKLLLAKKKLLQTKAALQQKLRSARAAECSKTNTSESKENNPPIEINNVEEESEEKATIYLVDSYLQEKKEPEEKKEEPEEKKSNKTDSIIIINDVTLHTNGKIVKKNLKRKNEEHLKESESKKQFPDCSKLNKKNDITIFDFDESEPEFVPLTHKSRKLNSSETRKVNDPNELSTETPLKQVKNVEKIKTELTLSNPRGRRPKLLVPSLDNDGKPKKLYSIIVPKTESIDISDSPKSTPPIVSDSKSPDEVPDSRDKKSPLKQATIIEMFSKVWMKQEKPNVLKNLTKEDTSTKSPPKINSVPKVDPINNAPSPRREYFEDDDSDTESRAEWIPEEYAEYKFKYTAQRMMQYKPIYKCKICQVLMPSYYKLFKHRKEHEQKDRPYICPQCGSEFKEVDDFSAHLRVHKGKHPYMCPKCDMGFWTKNEYDDHAIVHVLKKTKPSTKRFRCDVCSKEFSKLCDVERHRRVHTGEKPCICNICNKRFQQAHNLSKHLFTHLHIKPFICEHCNKHFGRNDVLRRHILTHSEEKPIKCSVCSKGFIRFTQLMTHMRKKHPEEPFDEFAEQSIEID